ncbi:MAG TPA: molybdate ABC transporter permease subunit [Acidimicrobiales bacterium]|nr:molybdate ABC transporter permease subunit [Acidimicrobiales bacterium]
MKRVVANVGLALAVLFLGLPLLGLLVRAPWASLGPLLASDELATSLRLSIVTSLSATLVAVLLGLPLAWALVRLHNGLLRRGLLALALLPMVLPPVVGGVALLLAFGRRGILGRPLDSWFGVSLAFTTAGAVMAAAFVALPFFVLAAQSGLRAVDPRFVEAGRTLGVGRASNFARVTLALARPALSAGVVVAWARALGEFGATVTFAGSLPGRTRTLPLAVYLALDSRPEAAIALSLVLLAVSIAVLALLRDRWLASPVTPQSTPVS